MDKTSISCGKALTIEHAQNLRDRIKKALEKSTSVDVRGADVEKADTAGLQLILALFKEAETLGGKCTWRSPSDALKKSAALLGVEQELFKS